MEWELVDIDGLTIAVENVHPTSGALTGRSLARSEPDSIRSMDGIRVAVDSGLLESMVRNDWQPTNAMLEMVAGGWWPSQIVEWFEWLSMSDDARGAALARGSIETGDEAYHFASDPRLVRPPCPPELVYPAPAAGQPPFTGPRGTRRWVEVLQPQPGTAVDSWAMMEVRGQRETLESMQNLGEFRTMAYPGSYWPKWGAAVSVAPGVIMVGSRFKDQNQRLMDRPGAAELTWYVPAVSVIKVEVSAAFQMVRPLGLTDGLRDVQALFSERGYGPLEKGWLTVTYSDGWRLCQLSWGGEWGTRQDETRFLDMAYRVLETVADAQGVPIEGEITHPEPITVEQANKVFGRDASASSTANDVFRFPKAVHWGITLNRSGTPNAPRPSESPSSMPPPPVVGAIHLPPPGLSSNRTIPPPGPPPPPPDPVRAGEVAAAVGVAAGSMAWGCMRPVLILVAVFLVSYFSGMLVAVGTGNLWLGGAVFFAIWAAFLLRSSIPGITGALRDHNTAARNQYHGAQWSAISEFRDNALSGLFGLGAAGLTLLCLIQAVSA